MTQAFLPVARLAWPGPFLRMRHATGACAGGTRPNGLADTKWRVNAQILSGGLAAGIVFACAVESLHQREQQRHAIALARNGIYVHCEQNFRTIVSISEVPSFAAKKYRSHGLPMPICHPGATGTLVLAAGPIDAGHLPSIEIRSNYCDGQAFHPGGRFSPQLA